MNSATFKSVREALGLSAQDIATQFDMDVRTVQRWESTHEPKPDVVAWLEELSDIFNDTLETLLDAVETDPDAPIDITRYKTEQSYLRAHNDGMPWKVHSQLVSTAALLLAGEGRDVCVHFAPVDVV